MNGLVGPLLTDFALRFVKATYRRPFTRRRDRGPGRRRPASASSRRARCWPLSIPSWPALAQPLAGEVAATRALLESIPFATGYAVEMAMLLDVHDAAGAEAMAQCDVGERRNHHQPLDALRPMAETVLAVGV